MYEASPYLIPGIVEWLPEPVELREERIRR
jgi:hypothetical protein